MDFVTLAHYRSSLPFHDYHVLSPLLGAAKDG